MCGMHHVPSDTLTYFWLWPQISHNGKRVHPSTSTFLHYAVSQEHPNIVPVAFHIVPLNPEQVWWILKRVGRRPVTAESIWAGGFQLDQSFKNGCGSVWDSIQRSCKPDLTISRLGCFFLLLQRQDEPAVIAAKVRLSQATPMWQYNCVMAIARALRHTHG